MQVPAEIATPTKFIEAIPATAFYLFKWPDAAVLNGEKRVDPADPALAVPIRLSRQWISLVLDESWLPPPSAEMVCLRKEFLDKDTTRIQWDRFGYHIEVAQTDSSHRRFPDYSEGFNHEVGQCSAVCQPLLELRCFGAQFRVAEFLHGRLKRIDLRDGLPVLS